MRTRERGDKIIWNMINIWWQEKHMRTRDHEKLGLINCGDKRTREHVTKISSQKCLQNGAK